MSVALCAFWQNCSTDPRTDFVFQKFSGLSIDDHLDISDLPDIPASDFRKNQADSDRFRTGTPGDLAKNINVQSKARYEAHRMRKKTEFEVKRTFSAKEKVLEEREKNLEAREKLLQIGGKQVNREDVEAKEASPDLPMTYF